MTTMTMVLMGVAVMLAAQLATTSPRMSAAARHLVWTAALGVMLLGPIAEHSGLRVEVPVPGHWLPDGPAPVSVAAGDVVASPLGGVEPTARGLEARVSAPEAATRAPGVAGASGTGVSGTGPAGTGSGVSGEGVSGEGVSGGGVLSEGSEADRSVATAALDRVPADAGFGDAARTVAPATTPDRSVGRPFALPGVENGAAGRVDASADPATAPARGTPGAVLALLWAVGALWLLAATVASHVVAWRMTSAGVTEPEPEVARRFAVLLVRHGVRPPVRLRVNPSIRVPATWGFVRPAIVLPPQHATWSRETLDRVLLHELAHVERRDCWTHLAGELARALHWFNPLAWHGVRRQRLESEHACDDLVLERTGSAGAYAEDLVRLARSLRPGGGALPRVALAMVKPSVLAGRVRAVLDPSVARGSVGPVGVTGTAAATLLLCLLSTAVVPVANASEPAQEAPPAAEPTPASAAAEPVSPPPGADAAAEAVAVAQGESERDPESEPDPETARTPEDPPTVVAAVSPAEVDMAVAGRPDFSSPSEPSVTEPPLPEPRTAGVGSALSSHPTSAQERCRYDGEGRRSTQINSDERRTTIRWETDDCTVEVEMIGDVEFSADDRSVTRLGRDARFEIEERVRGVRNRIRMESDGDGTIEREYWVDGRSAPWDANADAWLASILPELFRQTTINAEARVRRFLREGGPDRVFAETDEIFSDHVKRVYLELLMAEADLTEREFVRVIESAGEIDSDHGAAELLLAVIDQAGMRDAFQDPLLGAVARIDSDHEMTRVLQPLLASDLTTDQFDAVLRTAMSIDSDHNLSMVLQAVVREGSLSNAGRASYLAAVRSIDSDHNRAEVINAFLDEGTLTDQEIGAVIGMTEGMDSDHNRGEVLQRIAREYSLSGRQLDLYLESARRIDSDHQLYMTAEAVIGADAFGPGHVRMVLAIADDIDSDHNRAMVLQSLIGQHELAPADVAELLSVARGIDSDHQLATTLQRLVHDETLEGDGVGAVLDVVAGLGSSHQRTTVLVDLARAHDLTGAQRDAYLDLTDDLSSVDRDRARAALVERER